MLCWPPTERALYIYLPASPADICDQYQFAPGEIWLVIRHVRNVEWIRSGYNKVISHSPRCSCPLPTTSRIEKVYGLDDY